MTRLVDALEEAGVEWDISASGTWVTIRCEHSNVHIVEAPQGVKYYVWCDADSEQVVESCNDPKQAIDAGLRRSTIAASQP